MISDLVLSLMIRAKNHAKSFCERHIVADDPWPYADLDTESVLYIYKRYRLPLALKELNYRWNRGLLTGEQIKQLFNLPEVDQ